jgi:ankyrin repeat protein
VVRRPRDREVFEDELDGGSEVLRATRRGEIDRLRKILARRPREVEASGHMGRRPLHVAVDAQNVELVRFLLQAGANVDATSSRW